MKPSIKWDAFTEQLAAVLGVLEDDQFLVVTAAPAWAYVQFWRKAGSGIRAEAVSNRYIPTAHHLSPADVATLRALGWKMPSGTVPNFHQDWPEPVKCTMAAAVAVATLREVYDITDTQSLEYKAFDHANNTILLPTLGVRRTAAKKRPRAIPLADLKTTGTVH